MMIIVPDYQEQGELVLIRAGIRESSILFGHLLALSCFILMTSGNV
jgi:hypothetical protein